jgi:hypothetical protein
VKVDEEEEQEVGEGEEEEYQEAEGEDEGEEYVEGEADDGEGEDIPEGEYVEEVGLRRDRVQYELSPGFKVGGEYN